MTGRKNWFKGQILGEDEANEVHFADANSPNKPILWGERIANSGVRSGDSNYGCIP